MDYLRDRLVAGLRDQQIQKRLLGEENLTYEKAVQLATAMEFAEKGAAQITTTRGRIHRMQSSGSIPKRTQAASSGARRSSDGRKVLGDITCYCCGKRGSHTASQCLQSSGKALGDITCY
ncbi:hypothetical protein J6590_058225 [Homalodisca vitripennis]|nr:hypothetical protein J6590_058225 [Homalodisca vitripennis]